MDKFLDEEREIMEAKQPSIFHFQAEHAKKIINEQLKEDKDPLSRKYHRYHDSKKGKTTGINDKIKGAGVGDWIEQKLHRFSFFELMRTLFLDKSQIPKTFGNINIDYSIFPDNSYTEYVDGALPKNLSEKAKIYIEEKGGDLEREYLKNGLSKEEVELRKKTYGPNSLPEKKKTPAIVLFLEEITSAFSILLWIAAALSFVGYGVAPEDMSNLYLGCVIIIIVLLSGLFSFLQNQKSGEIMDSFKSFNTTVVTVTRDGQQQQIPAVEVVKGDVINIKTGEKVPADMRIFIIDGDLQLDNAPLTGESVAISASKECGEKGKDNALEARNLAFFSTNCKEGRGGGVVIRIGADTFMGKIADLASSAEAQATTLQVEINRFIKIIACVAVGLGILFFFLGLIVGFDLITNFIFALGIVVANCPEGLLSTVTVSLAITAKKMLSKNIMVKNLQSVETLGAITCICSDKTGTLTKNKMTVVHVFYDGEIKKTSDNQKNLRNEQNEEIPLKLFETSDISFNIFRFAGVCGSIGEFLTNTPEDYLPVVQAKSKFQKEHPQATPQELTDYAAQMREKYQEQYTEEYNNNIDDRYTNTDASESGIIKFFEKTQPINEIREQYPLHTVGPENTKMSIPFNSDLKWACFLRKTPNNNFWIAMKGAPERIIKRCTHYLMNGKDIPISKNFENKFKEANQAFALKGERVIGFAYKRLDPIKFPPDFPFEIEKEDKDHPRKKGTDPKTNFPLTDLTFVGLVAMEDPPRDGVREAVAKCKIAGIKVIMVTGDQSLTAASIAHQIGIISDLDDTPELIQRREKLATIEEAEAKSNTIIIEGGRLQAYLDRDSTMSDDNPNKNSFLRNWIMKRDVVFARTSPENKLCIVNACQTLSHVVAVTGDGVNDSPAIKKADIGIAMGKVGTDVAKDAADILLLDDNFPNILKGVKQGRVIFETLKKIIGYNLTSNIPELMPFLGYVILQFPLPLSTILILCVDVGTDILPNICQAYEPPEKGILKRKPRNVKTEKLCTLKLFFYGYFFTGILECSGCFITYFVVLNDYGFRPINVFYLTSKTGIVPSIQDYYNPYDNNYNGNSRAFLAEYSDLLGFHGESNELYIKSKKSKPNWDAETEVSYDLRLYFPHLPKSFWGDCHILSRGQSYDDYVCYRIEALRHAQCAFFLSVVFMQIANAFVWRTKFSSVYEHKLNNHRLHFAMIFEIALVMLIVYCPGLNTAFGARPLRIEHFFPCLGQHIILFFYGEFMKYMVRNSKLPDGSPGFFNKYFNY